MHPRGDCVRVCDEMQGMAILNFAHRGSDLVVSPAFDRKLADTSCISCGQCAAACPTGAITIRDEIGKAWRELYDPKKRVVFQIAPAVRVAVGEEFGLEPGVNALDKLVSALKMMGRRRGVRHQLRRGPHGNGRRRQNSWNRAEKGRTVPHVHLLLPRPGSSIWKRRTPSTSSMSPPASPPWRCSRRY